MLMIMRDTFRHAMAADEQQVEVNSTLLRAHTLLHKGSLFWLCARFTWQTAVWLSDSWK